MEKRIEAFCEKLLMLGHKNCVLKYTVLPILLFGQGLYLLSQELHAFQAARRFACRALALMLAVCMLANVSLAGQVAYAADAPLLSIGDAAALGKETPVPPEEPAPSSSSENLQADISSSETVASSSQAENSSADVSSGTSEPSSSSAFDTSSGDSSDSVPTENLPPESDSSAAGAPGDGSSEDGSSAASSDSLFSDDSSSQSASDNGGSSSGTPVCTCGAQPDDSGSLIHTPDCPLYTAPEIVLTPAAQAVAAQLNALPSADALLRAAENGELMDREALRAQINAARTALDALSEEEKGGLEAQALTKLTALEALFSAALFAAPKSGAVEPLSTDATGFTSGSTYTISTEAQLAKLADLVNSGQTGEDCIFQLQNDITLTAASWTPVGNASYSFQGTFDGAFHIIRGLKITTASRYCGLFGHIGTSAVIQNLGVEDAVINSSRNDVAVLVGNAQKGIIRQCYVTGAVTGNAAVSGILGSTHSAANPTTVSNCYARVALTQTGKTTKDAAGISGWNESTSILIENCYSACIGEKRPIAGWSDGTPVSNNRFSSTYFDKTLSPGFSSDAGRTDLGKTSVELQTQSTFSGWDFTSVWILDPTKNGGYPYLRGFTPGLGGVPGSISVTLIDHNGAPLEGQTVELCPKGTASDKIPLNEQGQGIYSGTVYTDSTSGTTTVYDVYVNNQATAATVTQTGADAVVSEITVDPSGGTDSHTDHCVCGGGIAAGGHTHTQSPAYQAFPADFTAGGKLPAGSYYLTEDLALTSTLEISGSVDLCLNGYRITPAAPESTLRLLFVNDEAVFNLTDCKSSGQLTGGFAASGAGIYNNGTFNLYGGEIAGNTASDGGAGIVNGESALFTMYGGKISDNVTEIVSEKDNRLTGGGVLNHGTFIMHDGVITGNKVSSAADISPAIGNGGGVFNCANASFTLHDGKISQNTASDSGGGIYNNLNSSLVINGGEISGNTANHNGGGIYTDGTLKILSSVDITQNKASSGSGGGMFVSKTSLFIMNAGSITQNKASMGNGGGIYLNVDNASHNPEIHNCTLTANTATFGGGMCVTGSADNLYKLQLHNADIRQNQADYGGGIDSLGNIFLYPDTTLTVTDNYAAYYGGGIRTGKSWTLQGNVTVKNNQKGSSSAPLGANNFYFSSPRTALTIPSGEVLNCPDGSIGITMEDPAFNFAAANSDDASLYAAKFFSDLPLYAVTADGAQLKLSVPVPTLTVNGQIPAAPDYGTASVRYTLTAENFDAAPAASALSVVWYADDRYIDRTDPAVPAVISGTDGGYTLTLDTSKADAGTYYFKVLKEDGGVYSNPCVLTLAKAAAPTGLEKTITLTTSMSAGVLTAADLLDAAYQTGAVITVVDAVTQQGALTSAPTLADGRLSYTRGSENGKTDVYNVTVTGDNYQKCVVAVTFNTAEENRTLYFDRTNNLLRYGQNGPVAAGQNVGWSAENNVLTLTNFEFTTSAPVGLELPRGCTLVLNGDNRITSTHSDSDTSYYSYCAGVACTGSSQNYTFTGTGSLTAIAGETTETHNSYGILLYDTYNLTVDGCTVTGVGGTSPHLTTGVWVDGNLWLKNGAKLTGKTDGASADSQYGYGVSVSASLHPETGCVLTGESTQGTVYSTGIAWSSSYPLSDGAYYAGFDAGSYGQPAKTAEINYRLTVVLPGAETIPLPKAQITRPAAMWQTNTGTGTGTLRACFTAASGGGTVTLLNDATFTGNANSDCFSFADTDADGATALTGAVTFDLAGHTLNFSTADEPPFSFDRCSHAFVIKDSEKGGGIFAPYAPTVLHVIVENLQSYRCLTLTGGVYSIENTGTPGIIPPMGAVVLHMLNAGGASPDAVALKTLCGAGYTFDPDENTSLEGVTAIGTAKKVTVAADTKAPAPQAVKIEAGSARSLPKASWQQNAGDDVTGYTVTLYRQTQGQWSVVGSVNTAFGDRALQWAAPVTEGVYRYGVKALAQGKDPSKEVYSESYLYTEKIIAPGGTFTPSGGTPEENQAALDAVFGTGGAHLENGVIHIDDSLQIEDGSSVQLDGDVTLDLGGHSVLGADSQPAITVNNGGSVEVTGGGSVTGGAGAAGIHGEENSRITVSDGVTVSGGGSAAGRPGGDGVQVADGGSITLSGGSVIGGQGGPGAAGGNGATAGDGSVTVNHGGNATGGHGGNNGQGGDGIHTGAGSVNIDAGSSAAGGNGGQGGDGGSGISSSGGQILVTGNVTGGDGGAQGGDGGDGADGEAQITVNHGGSVSGGAGGQNAGGTGGAGGQGVTSESSVTVNSGAEILGGNGGNGTSGGAGGNGASTDSGKIDVAAGGDICGGQGGTGTFDNGGQGGAGAVSDTGAVAVSGKTEGGDGGQSTSGIGGTGGNGAVTSGEVTVSAGGVSAGGNGGNGATAGGNGGNGATAGSTTVNGHATGGDGGNGTQNGSGGQGGSGTVQNGGAVLGGGSVTGGNGGSGAGTGSGGQGGSAGSGTAALAGPTQKDGENGVTATAKIDDSKAGGVKAEADLEELKNAAITQDDLKTPGLERINVTLSVEKTETPSDADRMPADAAKPLNTCIGSYFNITLSKTLHTDTDTVTTAVTAAQNKLTITLSIPTAMLGGSRYTVIRIHNGSGAALPTTPDDTVNPKTLTFESDLFSTYAIAYLPAENGGESENPGGSAENGQNSGNSSDSQNGNSGLHDGQPKETGAVSEDLSSALSILNGLMKGDVSPQWAPDIKAHRQTIETLLTLASRLTDADKKALSQPEKETMLAYFRALYELDGKDPAKLDSLFEPNEKKPVSPPASQPGATAQEPVQPPKDPASQPAADSLPTAGKQTGHDGDLAVVLWAAGGAGLGALLLIFLLVLLKRKKKKD